MEPQLLYGVLYLEINLMASLLVLFIRFKETLINNDIPS